MSSPRVRAIVDAVAHLEGREPKLRGVFDAMRALEGHLPPEPPADEDTPDALIWQAYWQLKRAGVMLAGQGGSLRVPPGTPLGARAPELTMRWTQLGNGWSGDVLADGKPADAFEPWLVTATVEPVGLFSWRWTVGDLAASVAALGDAKEAMHTAGVVALALAAAIRDTAKGTSTDGS